MKTAFFILPGTLLILAVVYSLFPTLYYLYLKTPHFLPGSYEKPIMLTFDDGPDPRYTPALLKILRENSVRAVFFVVAAKAEGNPDLIAEIQRDGHQIGLHSLEHSDAWLKGPAYQIQDFGRSLGILQGLGCGVSLYRAPWGHLNLTSLLLAKKHGLRVVLWTVMAQDWEKRSTSRRVLRRLFKRTKSGSVICLHDSGCGIGAAEGAPAHMLEALSLFLPEMRRRGFSFILPENIQVSAAPGPRHPGDLHGKAVRI